MIDRINDRSLAITVLVAITASILLGILNHLGVVSISWVIIFAPIWVTYCVVVFIIVLAIFITAIKSRHTKYYTRKIIDDR